MRMKPGDLVKHRRLRVTRGYDHRVWDPRSNRIGVLISLAPSGDWWKVLERDGITTWFVEDITLI